MSLRFVRRFRLRTFAIALVLLALLAGAAAFAVAWVYTERILVPRPYSLMPEFELGPVRAAEDGSYSVTLPVPEGPDPPQFARTGADGAYGLLWEGGSGRLGRVATLGADALRRAVTDVTGAPPTEGAAARLDATVFRPDPSAVGVPFEEVLIEGPIGPLAAWWTAGDPERAVLLLHGRRRADRTETLRILASAHRTGASLLGPAYRNHAGAPASPDGYYHYGASEAEDALAAVHWLHERGVREVTLVGLSMGASVALGALEAWPEPGPTVVGLVFEAPLVAPRPVFEAAARDMGVPFPGPLSRLSTWLAGRRADVDFGALDRRRSAASVEVPTLVLAGTADRTVPIELIDEFAEALPDVRYRRMPGVRHMEGWNSDPAGYEAAVTEFFDELGWTGGPGGAAGDGP